MIRKLWLVSYSLCLLSHTLCSQNSVDKSATQETKNLYTYLKSNSAKGFLFGHQDALSYGMGWKYDSLYRRGDVKEVCGDHPAVFGWDLGHIETSKVDNLDSVKFDHIRKNVQYAYALGAINTISWHSNNPVTGGNSWDTTRAVTHILPGGHHHELYRAYLNNVGSFLKSLVDDKGKAIPIIFRPYHEHNGSWFWWGEKSCTSAEYIALWRYTVSYMRDTLHIHHLLYAYSPNLYASEAEYLNKYPGDAWVDILGLDIYDLPEYNINYLEELPKNIEILARLGKKKSKVYALTETGFNKVPKNNWWTGSLLKNVEKSGIAWALVWRNYNEGQFFAPYLGHASASDFITFYKSPKTYFGKDLKGVYSK